MQITIPEGYNTPLNIRETERAIKLTRQLFESRLSDALNLERVSAPIFVKAGEGINDDLNGVERAVEFDILDIEGVNAQIVQSLAKWKRVSLKNYGYSVGEGLYTNMNAIRRDEITDNIHSIYVDQWDWEKVIRRDDRNFEYLQEVVNKIVNAIVDVKEEIKMLFPALKGKLKREVSFITSQQLEDMYPELDAKGREYAYLKEHKTVFIMQIGDNLASGKPHDGRAPDYDDWALNGDILFWNDVLGIAFEISSMGIRVDEQSLSEQLKKSGKEDRTKLKFHKMLLNGELPLSIGGGIGQSRLCMLILEKAHVGEVHSSIWPAEMESICSKNGIQLL
ncbi:MAG: aspartate--ammonia ligase [Clostridia bacterium]|nr:aspartate--ammonia ligase [Clostridia bacterium]